MSEIRPCPRDLSLDDVNIDPSSYVDPNGFVFHFEGEIFRAINRVMAPFYRSLFNQGVIDDLSNRGLLVRTHLTHIILSEIDCDLVYRHEKIEPLTYCVEWCPSMLRDAALVTIDLAIAGLEKDILLQDAYPWNVLFRGCKPVFIDLASLAPADSPLIWPAYQQFLSFFDYPLKLSQRKGKVARALLMNNISGINIGDYYENASFGQILRSPWLVLQVWLDGLMQQRTDIRRRVGHAVAARQQQPDPALRKGFFRKIQQRLSRYDFSDTHDIWELYYENMPENINRKEKIEIVGRLIRRLAPDSILDLGCNTGVFSLLAARESAARIVAVDSSEKCIERLYARAADDNLSITPLIADVVCPTPGFGFMGRQYPPLFDRVRSHTVLCLALMHHIHVSGRQSFDRIADMLGHLAEKFAIFEYVDPRDDNIDLLNAGRRIDYSLETVTQSLGRHFPNIETFPSDRPTRKILLCAK